MRRAILLSFVCCLLPSLSAQADPCGMVPPIYTGSQSPITRVGEQKTYVFYKDGLETIVLRPGFRGKVDEFGMLIPFPTPPAIRKAPENVFEQIAAAIDPPEVVIDLRPRPVFPSGGVGGFGGGGGSGFGGALTYDLGKDEVKVLREEAVGMYEVAVLAAGSSAALRRWMEDHRYVYPDGMDDVCDEYVEIGWCFVAVKTKVGQKKEADPRPGQREVETALPEGASFDGHVQAMGFRFETDELVVPMRLSAFNKGELRNIVYLLADRPSRIRLIPEEFVVRQVAGGSLFKNVTEPLPVRIIGGTERDVPSGQWRSLREDRNPRPHNGVAAELFAADLAAADSGRLLSEAEEDEKMLANISERLGLRGGEIDAAVADATAAERERQVRASLAGIRRMTMSVIDGDFPREVIAENNMTFATYRMPSSRNRAGLYDAKEMGQPPQKEGLLRSGAITRPELDESRVGSRSSGGRPATAWLLSAAIVLTLATAIGAARWLPAAGRP